MTTTSRRQLYVDLRDKQTKCIIRCAAAHIEGGNDRSKGNKQLDEALTYVEKAYAGQNYSVDMIAVGVDLNEEKNTTRNTIFANHQFCTDSDNNASEITKNRKIDHVYSKVTNPNLTIQRQGHVWDAFKKASDHHLVSSTLILSSPAQPTQPQLQPQPMHHTNHTQAKPYHKTQVQPTPIPVKSTLWGRIKIFCSANAKLIIPAAILTLGIVATAIYSCLLVGF